MLSPRRSCGGESEVDARGDLFARIGVAHGLRLMRTSTTRGSRWRSTQYELPETAPAGVDVAAAWEDWRTAVQSEARPGHVGWFEYSLQGVYRLPELDARADSRPARAASVLAPGRRVRWPNWPDGWQESTIRKIGGEARRWQVTSPLDALAGDHTAWLADGPMGERPLHDRWLVPTSLLRGQGERYPPPATAVAGVWRTDWTSMRSCGAALEGLGLNVYPTDGQRIGPQLLDALADAWRGRARARRAGSTSSWVSCATRGSTSTRPKAYRTVSSCVPSRIGASTYCTATASMTSTCLTTT